MYQKRFMHFMLQLSEPGHKEIKLGHGIPKKYLKQREEKKKQEQEELLHEQEKGKDSLAKNAAQEIVRNSFF